MRTTYLPTTGKSTVGNLHAMQTLVLKDGTKVLVTGASYPLRPGDSGMSVGLDRAWASVAGGPWRLVIELPLSRCFVRNWPQVPEVLAALDVCDTIEDLQMVMVTKPGYTSTGEVG